MLGILIAVETNPHGQPLHVFEKVAAGILERQKAEQRSGGARQIFDSALVIPPKCIHMDTHGLTWAHVLKLSFLEVGGHPDIVDGNDGKQTLSRLNSLAEFYSLAANDAADRSIDSRVAKIQFRGKFIRLGALHFAGARL